MKITPFRGRRSALCFAPRRPRFVQPHTIWDHFTVDSGHEKLRLHVLDRWLEVQDDELSSHYDPETASMCRLARQKPLPFLYPVRRQACMHTNQPSSAGERERCRAKLGKAALAFPDSRFYLGQRKNRNVIEAPAVHAPFHSLQVNVTTKD